MIKHWKNASAALLLSISAFGAGAAFTGAAHAQTLIAIRGDRGSDASVVYVRDRLGALIGQLDRDQRDYDGHRVAAINLMRQAQGQLNAALAWDRAH